MHLVEKEKFEQKMQIEVGGHYENLGIEEGEGNDHNRLREARDSSLVHAETNENAQEFTFSSCTRRLKLSMAEFVGGASVR